MRDRCSAARNESTRYRRRLFSAASDVTFARARGVMMLRRRGIYVKVREFGVLIVIPF